MKKIKAIREQKGITLVALIITIIVLIILATVSIKAVLDMNFIDIASNATINYAEARGRRRETNEWYGQFFTKYYQEDRRWGF